MATSTIEEAAKQWKQRHRLASTRILLVLSLLWAIGISKALGQSGVPGELSNIRLDRTHHAAPGDALPPGWEARPVRGFGAPDSRVVRDERHGLVIRFEAEGEAAFFWHELPDRLDPAAGRLRWSWRVDRPVASANLGVRELDDSPARFFVVFGAPGLLSRPKMIFYTWGNEEPSGDVSTSWSDRRVKVIVLRNDETPPGTWTPENRDLLHDFQAAFGEEPEPISAIGFMIDTDHTKEGAISFLGSIWWTESAETAHGT